MPPGPRTILVGGRVVDPASGVDALLDVELEDGRVSRLAPALPTSDTSVVLDVRGKVVMPGLIDPHVHVSGLTPALRNGHRMMARVGVTTALDLEADVDDLMGGLASAGAGLNVAFVCPMVPGRTVSSADPSAAELERFIRTAIESGGLGIKCLGGHFPITPAAIRGALVAAERLGAYVAVHAGSTEHGSDIQGLEELIDLAEDRPVHVAHVNSYCRGQQTGDPLAECLRALAALRRAPRARSESYLSPWNGTGGACLQGVPVSAVTRTCLRLGGYAQSEAGLADAIDGGWAHVWITEGDQTVLATGSSGVAAWRARATHVGLSFQVNPPETAIALAVAREPDGRFTIEALSTDGGGIPRNTTVEQGMALVRFGAISLGDFVRKASSGPAAMLGLPNKGRLDVGADADITVLDLSTGRAVRSLVAGQVVMTNGRVVGGGGTLLTTNAGEATLRQKIAAAGAPTSVRIEIVRNGF